MAKKSLYNAEDTYRIVWQEGNFFDPHAPNCANFSCIGFKKFYDNILLIANGLAFDGENLNYPLGTINETKTIDDEPVVTTTVTHSCQIYNTNRSKEDIIYQGPFTSDAISTQLQEQAKNTTPISYLVTFTKVATKSFTAMNLAEAKEKAQNDPADNFTATDISAIEINN